MTSFDVVVVGGGPGGLSAAFQARRRGASVCLVEADRLGGDCTWTGCVPSKALIERAHRVHSARGVGWTGAVDFAAVMDEVSETVTAIARDEDAAALKRHDIAVRIAHARLVDARTVDVEGEHLSAGTIVLATGAAPLVPDAWREARPLTSDSVFDLRTQPRSLAVIGGGPIGVELAQALQRLGSAVVLVEAAERLLPSEEPEAGRILAEVLAEASVDVRTGSPVAGLRREGEVVRVELDGGDVVVDEVLVALGRRPTITGLDLDAAGVETRDSGHIVVDDRLRTTARGVYAVGDVTGMLPFTHVADEMGRSAVDDALGRMPRRFSTDAVPWVTFTDPEVGRVGLSEAQAFERYGDDARVAFLPMRRVDRARVSGRTEGFVKLVTGPRGLLRHTGGGRLLGATVMSPGGGDVVHSAAVLMRTGGFAGRLAQTVHAYPSWALGVRQAAAMLFGEQAGRRARPARPDGDGTR